MPDRNYYQKLAGDKLHRVYELATPRVRQYLAAEVAEVVRHITPGIDILELGCGYGRVLEQLTYGQTPVYGIDTSLDSLRLATRIENVVVEAIAMRAGQLAFKDNVFDLVFAVQNGISAFKEDRRELIEEALRVLKSGGVLLLSSYSPRIWADRLEWFEQQAGQGLIGAIDYTKTGDGNIICTDGFTAATISAAEFQRLADGVAGAGRVYEVDGSSVFLEIVKP